MFFKGEFETGNLYEFTSASGALETSIVRSGNYAGRQSDNTNFLKDFGSMHPTLFISGYFRWTTTLSDGWYVMLGDGATANQFALFTASGSRLKIVVNGVTYYGSKVLLANVWYKITVEFHTSDSGWFHVIVDGTTDILVTGVDTRSGSDSGIKLVKWQGTNNPATTCYVDILTASDYRPVGIKVSKPGFDVNYCADKDLVFSSELNTLITYGSRNMTPYADAWVHNLGYIPIHLYAGFLSTKPTVVGLIGQNTPDNSTYVQVTTTQVTNDNMDEWAASALVYLFYDQL